MSAATADRGGSANVVQIEDYCERRFAAMLPRVLVSPDEDVWSIPGRMA